MLDCRICLYIFSRAHGLILNSLCRRCCSGVRGGGGFPDAPDAHAENDQ